MRGTNTVSGRGTVAARVSLVVIASRPLAATSGSGRAAGRPDPAEWPLMLRDLSAFYESRIGGRAPDRESPGRYARYLAWLRESAPDSTAFWREALAGFRAPTPVLPPAPSATARG